MAKLELPSLFRDGMVLQRQKPVCVWGRASGADRVTVTLGEASAAADVREGRWKTFLPPMQAARGLPLTVAAGDAVMDIRDVAVGEVWLAGGQSNMEFLLRDDADRETAVRLTDADVRCFEVPKIAYEGQENDRDYSQVGRWRKAGPGDSEFFTAVGFYFAIRLKEALDVPVGIVNCTWGGTSASAWVDESDLTGELAFYLNRAREARKNIDPATEKEEYKKIQRMIDSLPPMNARVNEKPLVPDEGMKASMAHMDRYNLCAFSPFRPCGLFHTMLEPIAPYTFRGVIWYQGESDEYFGGLFEPLTRALIRRWRVLWNEDLPFLMVQLPPFEYMMEPLNFVPIREMQERIAQDTPLVSLVCAMDAGLRYDIHPKRKQPIGRRLALQALRRVYGLPVPADSPSVRGIRKEGAELVLSFRHGDGLHIKGETPGTIDLSVNGAEAAGFTAFVREEALVLRSPLLENASEATVRFARRPWCEDHLYNGGDLPAFPFEITWKKD